MCYYIKNNGNSMPHFYGQLPKTGYPQACKLAHAWNYPKSAFLLDFHGNLLLVNLKAKL